MKTNKPKQPKTLWGWEWKHYRAAITWGVLAGTLATLVLLRTLKDAQKASLKPVGQTIFPKVEIAEAKEPISWSDAIRVVFPADEAGRMVRICLQEVKGYKGDPRYALNDKNANGSWDYGWCQVNSVHKPKSMSDYDWKTYLEDPMNHAKEVRRIFLNQWWNAWSVYNKGLVK